MNSRIIKKVTTSLLQRLTSILAPLLLGGVGGGLLSSCGDFFELETQEALKAAKITIGQHVVALAPGYAYKVPVSFTPTDVPTTSVFWLAEDDKVATVRNDSVVGVAEGLTRLFAFSVLDNLRDTCYAYVLPPLEVIAGRYAYDMVVYADVTVNGTRLTQANAQDYKVLAFVGDQVRGIGQMRRHKDTEYMELRVWGASTSTDEQVELRCYLAKEARIKVFPVTDLTFDGEQHGSLKHPLQLTIDHTAKDYLPDIADEDDNTDQIIDDQDEINVNVDPDEGDGGDD